MQNLVIEESGCFSTYFSFRNTVFGSFHSCDTRSGEDDKPLAIPSMALKIYSLNPIVNISLIIEKN